MDDLKLPLFMKKHIIDIAKSYKFFNISFDTKIPHETDKLFLANTEDKNSITYNYLFLNPAQKFYLTSFKLFRKATIVLTLHERMHHLSPFNSKHDVDDWLVHKKACEEYGNPREMMFLDILTSQIMCIPNISDNQLFEYVHNYITNYSWINSLDKNEIERKLIKRKNYSGRNFIKLLSEELF